MIRILTIVVFSVLTASCASAGILPDYTGLRMLPGSYACASNSLSSPTACVAFRPLSATEYEAKMLAYRRSIVRDGWVSADVQGRGERFTRERNGCTENLHVISETNRIVPLEVALHFVLERSTECGITQQSAPTATAPTAVLAGQLDLPVVAGTRLCTDDEFGPTVPGDCLLIEAGEYEDVIAIYSDIVAAAGFSEIHRNGLSRLFARDRACAERLFITDIPVRSYEPSQALVFHFSCARPQ